MAVGDLLPHVDALIRLLEAGHDVRAGCEVLLGLLDAEPDLATESLPSVSMGSMSPVAEGEGGTWVPDDATAGLGLTVGTWAPDVETRATPTDLRSICGALLEEALAPDEALEALRAWRELRRPPARYVLGEPLGSGGMGDVLRADDAALDRPIAVKVLRKTSARARRNFVAEAKLTARLQHPGIVPVHDVGETPDGRPYFAMMEVRGRSLRQVVAAGELVGRRARLDVFRRVCETVAYAHDQGVLHLDLKPDNVMIGAFGEVLVMDWGLAREVSDGGATLRKVAGTPRYMAPEQATEGHRLDVRSDVYALGAILYELLADAPAFRGSDVTVILTAVRAGDFRPPRAHAPHLPRELDELVVHAMARDPDQRIGSVRELLAEVEAYLDGRELATVTYGPLERARKWAERNRSLVRGATVAGLVGALVLVASTGVYVQRVGEARVRAESSAMAARQAQAEAQRASVEALLASARLQMDAGHLLAARDAFEEAATLLESLGEDPVRARLGLAETFMWQQPAITRTVPRELRQVWVDEAHVWLAGLGGAGRMPLSLASVEWLSDEPSALVRVDGELHIAELVDDAVVLRDVDGKVVRRLEVPGPNNAAGTVAFSVRNRTAVRLADGERVAVDWEACEQLGWVDGPWQRCGPSHLAQVVDRESGAVVYYGMVAQANPELGLVLAHNELRPVVWSSPHERVWSADDGPLVATSADDDNIVWAGQDGRIAVRDWQTGSLRLRFDQGNARRGYRGVAASFDGRLVVAVDARRDGTEVKVLRRAGRRWNQLASHGLATSRDGGLVVVAEARGQLVLMAGEQRRRFAVNGDVRSIAVADDGRIAWATNEGQVGLVAPGAAPRHWQLDGRLVGLSFDGAQQRLAVVGTEGLFELGDGDDVRHTVLERGTAWGVAPMGRGWVVSHPARGNEAATWVVDGDVKAVIPGKAEGYNVAAAPSGDRVVVATHLGGRLWDGHEVVELGDTRTLGATWAAHGPVLGGMTSELRFYAPDGEPLHRWRLPSSPVAVASYGGGLWVHSLEELLPLPFAPTAPPPDDPVAEAWFPQP